MADTQREISPDRSASMSRLLLRSFGRSLVTSNIFGRKAIWVWPVIAAVMLGLIGWLVRGAVEGAMQDRLREEVTTILDADVTALRIWFKEREQSAELVANDREIIAVVQDLVELGDKADNPEAALLQSKPLHDARRLLQRHLDTLGCRDFFVVGPSTRVMASKDDSAIGKPLGGYQIGRASCRERV